MVRERENLHELSDSEAARTLSSKIQRNKKPSQAAKRKGTAFYPAKVSVFMETLTASPDDAIIRVFDPLEKENFIPALTKAISDSKPNRRPGHDQIATEMLLLDVSLSFSVLLALYTAMGRLGNAPRKWLLSVLVSIRRDPKLWREITDL